MEKKKCPFCNKLFDRFGINSHIGQMIRYEKLKNKKQKHLK